MLELRASLQEFSVPQPSGSLDISLTHFQSQMLQGLTFPVQVPWAGEPDVGLGSLILWGTSAAVISLLIVGHLTRVVGSE